MIYLLFKSQGESPHITLFVYGWIYPFGFLTLRLIRRFGSLFDLLFNIIIVVENGKIKKGHNGQGI